MCIYNIGAHITKSECFVCIPITLKAGERGGQVFHIPQSNYL